MINVRGEGRSGGEEVIDCQIVKENAQAGGKQNRNHEEKLISLKWLTNLSSKVALLKNIRFD